MQEERILSHLNPRLHIGARIGLSIACVSLLLTMVTSLITGFTAARNTEESIGETLAGHAFQMADKLDRGMFERYREIQLMAMRPELENPLADPALKRRVLESMKSTYPVHSWIGLTDANGVVIAGTGGLLVGKNTSGRPWFSGARSGPYVGDVHSALLLEKHLPAPADGNLRFVDVAAPVHDKDGRFIGVLCSHLTWEWARQIKDTLLVETEDTFGVELAILGADGKMLLGPDSLRDIDIATLHEKFKTLATTHRHSEVVWPDDFPYLTGVAGCMGYHDYPGLGWLVVARKLSTKAFAPAKRLMWSLMIYQAIAALLVASLAWYIAFRLTVPIRQIARLANRIRVGDHGVDIPTGEGRDEVSVLASSLAEMLLTLQSQNTELAGARDRLEEKVTERTAELEGANRELKNEVVIRRNTETALRREESHLNEAQKIGMVGSLEFDYATGKMYWSEQFFRLLGLEPGEVTPSLDTLAGHVQEHDRQAFLDLFKQTCTTGDDREIHLITTAGKERYCLAKSSCLDGDGDGAGGLRVTLMDITERKQGEILRADVERIMRHDLKTPLNAVINLPNLMLDNGNVNDKQKKYLGWIQEAGYRMLQQVNESLSLYKMEMGTYQVERQPVDLIKHLRHIERELAIQFPAQKTGLGICCDDRPICPEDVFVVAGEDLLLYTMMSNLIKNALEAAPADGEVTVNLKDESDGKIIEISNASVVPDELCDVFFEKYATHGKKGGTGLGNYSAKMIALTHGGDIGFRSSLDEGTTVYVQLPGNAAVVCERPSFP